MSRQLRPLLRLLCRGSMSGKCTQMVPQPSVILLLGIWHSFWCTRKRQGTCTYTEANNQYIGNKNKYFNLKFNDTKYSWQTMQSTSLFLEYFRHSQHNQLSAYSSHTHPSAQTQAQMICPMSRDGLFIHTERPTYTPTYIWLLSTLSCLQSFIYLIT